VLPLSLFLPPFSWIDFLPFSPSIVFLSRQQSSQIAPQLSLGFLVLREKSCAKRERVAQRFELSSKKAERRQKETNFSFRHASCLLTLAWPPFSPFFLIDAHIFPRRICNFCNKNKIL